MTKRQDAAINYVYRTVRQTPGLGPHAIAAAQYRFRAGEIAEALRTCRLAGRIAWQDNGYVAVSKQGKPRSVYTCRLCRQPHSAHGLCHTHYMQRRLAGRFQSHGEKLTPRARYVWQTLWEAQQQGALPPSLRELMSLCDISSTSVARYQVKKLIRLGIVEQDNQKSRAYHVVQPYSWVEP